MSERDRRIYLRLLTNASGSLLAANKRKRGQDARLVQATDLVRQVLYEEHGLELHQRAESITKRPNS